MSEQKYSAMVVATRAARSRSKRRLVGGGDDGDRALESFFAERILEELADFAAAFADQREHRQIGLRAAGHHSDQGALADAAASEDSHALAAAAREHAIDGADAAAERLADRRAVKRLGRRSVKRAVYRGAVRAVGIERLAGGVDDAAEQSFTDREERLHPIGNHVVAETDAAEAAERHGKNRPAAEADDFRRVRSAVAGDYFAAFTYGAEGSLGFDQEPDGLGDAAGGAPGGNLIEALEKWRE